jgi:aldehyde dehydrogenase (NAD+)
MGGKNAQIIMADADLNLALEGAVWGAFGTTGQRCTATSRIYVEKKIYEDFRKALIRRAHQLKIGNGLNPRTQMGPIINEIQRERVHGYVKSGLGEGAKMECGGEFAKGPGLARGYFYKPTVFTHTDPKMKIVSEEIFGPVVCVIPIQDLEDAIHQANDTTYGLSTAIYSRNVNNAMRAVRDIEAGITYINSPTIGAEVHLPFGGVKNTGNGHREAGETALDIFSEWKSVFVDYSGRLQKAQIDVD